MNIGVVLIIQIVLWAFAVIYFHVYLSRRTSKRRIFNELQAEIEQMTREIDAITDRDISLVEARVKHLQDILEQADRRIAVAAREQERQVSEERAYAELGRRKGAWPRPEPDSSYTHNGARAGRSTSRHAEAPPTPDLFAAGVEQSAPRSQAASTVQPSVPEQNPDAETEVGNATDSQSNDADEIVLELPRFSRRAVPIQPSKPPINEQVLSLSRSGFSRDLIASKLGITVAETDLILALADRSDADGQDSED